MLVKFEFEQNLVVQTARKYHHRFDKKPCFYNNF